MSAWRVLPPVVTPGSARDIGAAALALMRAPERPSEMLCAALRETYGRPVVALTDSATSALVFVLLRVAVPNSVVAIPGFGCIDVAAAVQGARMRAIPYDVDPATLAPDLASLRAALERGARVVVASHLFGFAIGLDDARALCTSFDAVLIEDAAQAFGALWNGTPAGALADISVLSFGRGKGIGGGGGGAVLGVLPHGDAASAAWTAPREGAVHELTTLLRCALVHLINRPSMYALPSSIPSLRLGEMVYHAAHEPTGIGRVSAALARSGLSRMRDDLALRERRARRLVTAARAGRRCTPIEPQSHVQATWLRAPMLLRDGSAPSASLGVYRAYPRAVSDQSEIADILCRPLPPLPGATLLASQLVTLPTHARLAERDLRALERWLTSDSVVA